MGILSMIALLTCSMIVSASNKPFDQEELTPHQTKQIDCTKQAADTRDEHFQYLLGNFYVKQGDFIQAEKCYTRAALRGNAYAQSELATVHCRLGNMYLEQKKAEEAEAYYKKCADQGKSEGARELVILYDRQSRLSEAEYYAKRYVEYYEQLPKDIKEVSQSDYLGPAYLLLSELCRKQGKREEAEHYKTMAENLLGSPARISPAFWYWATVSVMAGTAFITFPLTKAFCATRYTINFV